MGDASGGKAAEGAALFQTGSDARRPSPREGSHAFGTKLTCGHEAPLAPRSLCPMRLLKDRTLGESREVTGGRSAAGSGVTRLTTRWSRSGQLRLISRPLGIGQSGIWDLK